MQRTRDVYSKFYRTLFISKEETSSCKHNKILFFFFSSEFSGTRDGGADNFGDILATGAARFKRLIIIENKSRCSMVLFPVIWSFTRSVCAISVSFSWLLQNVLVYNWALQKFVCITRLPFTNFCNRSLAVAARSSQKHLNVDDNCKESLFVWHGMYFVYTTILYFPANVNVGWIIANSGVSCISHHRLFSAEILFLF